MAFSLRFGAPRGGRGWRPAAVRRPSPSMWCSCLLGSVCSLPIYSMQPRPFRSASRGGAFCWPSGCRRLAASSAASGLSGSMRWLPLLLVVDAGRVVRPEFMEWLRGSRFGGRRRAAAADAPATLRARGSHAGARRVICCGDARVRSDGRGTGVGDQVCGARRAAVVLCRRRAPGRVAGALGVRQAELMEEPFLRVCLGRGSRRIGWCPVLRLSCRRRLERWTRRLSSSGAMESRQWSLESISIKILTYGLPSVVKMLGHGPGAGPDISTTADDGRYSGSKKFTFFMDCPHMYFIVDGEDTEIAMPVVLELLAEGR